MYLWQFKFATEWQEIVFLQNQKRTCYTSVYPFGIFPNMGYSQLEFDQPITILYGGNGSGKTTILNIIAEYLGLNRSAMYNRSNFFLDYIECCNAIFDEIPSESRIITSDDVFDMMLNVRALNDKIDCKREELFGEYYQLKNNTKISNPLEEYDKLKRMNLARRTSASKYVKKFLRNNVQEYSNGESAFLYFVERIKENALYLLDEPENSLSPDKQLELVRYIEDSARFFKCQFIIATHSPFMLSLKYAKIYDLNELDMVTKKWTELKNMKIYYDFFLQYRSEFE